MDSHNVTMRSKNNGDSPTTPKNFLLVTPINKCNVPEAEFNQTLTMMTSPLMQEKQTTANLELSAFLLGSFAQPTKAVDILQSPDR